VQSLHHRALAEHTPNSAGATTSAPEAAGRAALTERHAEALRRSAIAPEVAAGPAVPRQLPARSSNGHALERTTFETSRLLEFFTEKELTMQIGWERIVWPIALLKELIDNALDACETADIAPNVVVTVEEDAVSVQDNGPGLPERTLVRSLDYLARVSDKTYYVSPTRGQLGNALKCVWAAPYVMDGSHGRVEVVTGGRRHTIDVSLDRIIQAPTLRHSASPDGFVKSGTLVRIPWPGVASYLQGLRGGGLHGTQSAETLLRGYSLFNPHATFTLRRPGRPDRTWLATDPAWRKWRPDTPTSAHWYTVDRLRDLIAAYLAEERRGRRGRTIRELVAEFNGLSGTAKQKAVLEAAGLSRARLSDLATGDDIDRVKVATLLAAMQRDSRPIKPAALGTIGKAHLTRHLIEDYGAQEESITYRKAEEVDDDGLPLVLEVAFGVLAEAHEGRGRQLAAGVNWAAALSLPFQSMPFLVGKARADEEDPVVLIAHLAKPGAQFADRGKGRLGDV
jgi:DNA topoisomerase VI subunit B